MVNILRISATPHLKVGSWPLSTTPVNYPKDITIGKPTRHIVPKSWENDTRFGDRSRRGINSRLKIVCQLDKRFYKRRTGVSSERSILTDIVAG